MNADVRLNEYDKDEWLDIARKFKPDLTDAEYDAMWDRFCAYKREHERQKRLN